MFTNSIRHIFQVGSTVLTTDYFSELEWPSFFLGTRDEFAALVYGFFHGHNELRMNENEYIFLFDPDGEEPFFPISGEEGFYRFVDHVFLGDENMAIIQSSSVLTNKNLKALNWNKVLKLGKKKLSEFQEEMKKLENEREELKDSNTKLEDIHEELRNRSTEIENTNEELKNKNTELENTNEELRNKNTELENEREELKNRKTELENKNKKLDIRTGEARRKLGDLVESLLQDEALKAFFRKENRNVKIDYISKDASVPLERLTLTQQQDQAYNRSNEVEREFDIILSSQTPTEPGPVIVIEVKHFFDLTKEKKSQLDPVDKLKKNLEIMRFLFPKYEGRKFIGGFAFVNYSEDAKQKAQKAGFYLIQIRPKESAIEKINEDKDNFKPTLY